MATFLQRLGYALAGGAVPSERKESQAMRAVLAVPTGQNKTRWMPATYDGVSREGYSRNPYVYAAIRQKGMAFAGIQWKAYSGPDKKTEFDEHPMLSLLKRPNPRQAKAQFFECIAAYLDLDGNAFLERVGPKGGPPKELYAHRPDRVSIIPGTPADPIAGYLYQIGSAKVTFPAENILHLKFFNPIDDWRGMSPMTAASMSIDQSNASKAWNVGLLQNGARPQGAMVSETRLDPEQYSRLKEEIQGDYAGFMNAGRPVLLDGGLKWEEMGLSPNDMHWIEGQKLSAREIAIVYNIAPELIGDSANKTYSNYSEARVALYQENILPLCDWVRDELNMWLSPLYDDAPYLDYDKEDIEALQEDRNALWERADKAFVSGWITMDEARTSVGLDQNPDFGEKFIFELPQRAPATPPALPGSSNNPTAKVSELPPGQEGEGSGNAPRLPAGKQGNSSEETGGGAEKEGEGQQKIVSLPFGRGPSGMSYVRRKQPVTQAG